MVLLHDQPISYSYAQSEKRPSTANWPLLKYFRFFTLSSIKAFKFIALPLLRCTDAIIMQFARNSFTVLIQFRSGFLPKLTLKLREMRSLQSLLVLLSSTVLRKSTLFQYKNQILFRNGLSIWVAYYLSNNIYIIRWDFIQDLLMKELEHDNSQMRPCKLISP